MILISSDPSLWKNGSDVQQDSGDTCASENLAQSEENEPIGFAYELRSTLRAYERVRGGRGKEAADRLCRASKAHNGEFVHFSMCDPKAKGSPPLGWALSDKAKERIESYLIPSDDPPPCYQRNHDYLVKLNDILK